MDRNVCVCVREKTTKRIFVCSKAIPEGIEDGNTITKNHRNICIIFFYLNSVQVRIFGEFQEKLILNSTLVYVCASLFPIHYMCYPMNTHLARNITTQPLYLPFGYSSSLLFRSSLMCGCCCCCFFLVACSSCLNIFAYSFEMEVIKCFCLLYNFVRLFFFLSSFFVCLLNRFDFIQMA